MSTEPAIPARECYSYYIISYKIRNNGAVVSRGQSGNISHDYKKREWSVAVWYAPLCIYMY